MLVLDMTGYESEKDWFKASLASQYAKSANGEWFAHIDALNAEEDRFRQAMEGEAYPFEEWD